MTSFPAFPDPAPQTRPHFTRIERVLDYIHAHLDQPLSLEQLAEQSCWSRWQLQRVFLHETGQTVAHYVRELKLSLTSSPTLALRVTGGGFPLLGDSCSRSTGFLLHRAA